MKTTAQGWKVVDEGTGVLCYEYTFRKGSTSNAMTARLADGTLMVVSPPCGVSDAVIKDLEGFGKVSALVANNGFHHLGLPSWSKAHPTATLHAAPPAAERIAKKHPSLPSFRPIHELVARLATGVRVHTVPGISHGELWLQVAKIWYVSDGFFNMVHVPGGLVGLMFKFTDSGPGFRVNGLQKAFFIKDKPGFKRWVLAQLDEAIPDIVVPSHGAIEGSTNVAAQMRALIVQRF